MDIEFHYYMTHLIALRAGFKPEDASTVAYASQFTDDNIEAYTIQGADTPYENLISQTSDISKPQEERLSIYPIFHFCPGAGSEIFHKAPSRRDGKYHLLDTIPDNTNAQLLFVHAMNSGDLYRIGIGAHMYADTFCHRDFTGWKDEFNWIRLKGFEGAVWSEVGPAIGHALAAHQPDIPALVWEDTRLTSKFKEKRNKTQILSAAGRVFDFFCRNTKPTNAEATKQKLLGELSAAMGEEADTDSDARVKARIKNHKALLGAGYVDYDETEWFDDAVDEKDDSQTIGTSDVKVTYSWKEDYRKSDWFKFQEAVKAHRAQALKVLEETFKKMEIDVARGDW